MKYNRWTIVIKDNTRVGGRLHSECVCDCGTVKTVSTYSVVSGNSKSCGCLNKEEIIKRNKKRITHGMSKSSEYISYRRAKERCNNKQRSDYKRYGGRGIRFLFKDFKEFFLDVGNKPNSLYSIDRIDNNDDYKKGNIKWSTPKEQAQNRSSSVNIKYKGEVKCLSEWARIVGIKRETIRERMKRGWSIEECFNKPLQKQRKNFSQTK